MSQDPFDEAIESSVVDEPSLDLSGSPLRSSGGVSDEGMPVHSTHEHQGGQGRSFECVKCKKILKTANGFYRHNLLHQVQSANDRKPDLQSLLPRVEEIVLDFLREEEAGDAFEPESNVCDFIVGLSPSIPSENWFSFLASLSEPVLKMLSARTKVLPTYQYEDYLKQLNFLMNDDASQDNLKRSLLLLNPNVHLTENFAGMLLYKMLMKLFDELFLCVCQEMRSQTAARSDIVLCTSSSTLSVQEQKAFEMHMEKIVRAYYYRGFSSKSPSWFNRCRCLRKTFVTAVSGDIVSSKLFLDEKSWVEDVGGVKKLSLNSRALDFFKVLEVFLRKSLLDIQFVDFKERSEKIISDLILPHNSDHLNAWFLLTKDHLSEADAIVFLKDVITIMANLSSRLTVDKVRRMEESHGKSQKHALRADLKRN